MGPRAGVGLRAHALLLVFGLCGVLPDGAAAAELTALEVTHSRGVYQLSSVTRFSAPPAAVFAVLADYDGFTQISSAIVASRVLDRPAADGAPRVYTRVRGCVLFFCGSIDRVEHLYLSPHQEIRTRVEPELSDLRDGASHWRFSALDDGGTRVDFEMHMTPDFWIPPLIGPRLVKRRLLRDGVEAVARIEALAHERAQCHGYAEAPEPAQGCEPEQTLP